MAKKKTEDKATKTDSTFLDASFIRDNPKEILHVSPSVDAALGGGIPKGSWVIIGAKPKFGKSSLIVHSIAKFLNQFPDSEALYVDTEHRLKPFHLSHPLLDVSRLHVLQSTKGNILSSEDFLTQTELWIKDHPDSIVVVDSTSSLCSSAEQVMDSISGDIRGKGPKILAHFCRKMAPIIPIQDTILVLVTHLIANTSGYGSPFNEDSGTKIQYQSDVKLRGKGLEKWEKDGKQIGQIMNWNVEWSALGPPGGEIKSYLRYNHGIDEVMELVEQAINFGLIVKGGAWFTCNFDGEEKKLQGQDNLCEFIRSEPKYVESLTEQVREFL